MVTTKEDIRGWLERGKEKNATHVVVMCDSFDYQDYPVFIESHENIHTRLQELAKGEMQRIMEVYKLSMPWNLQLNEHRAYHL